MDYLALVHVVAISFWLGVISVEVIFERARIDKAAVVLLHRLTDRYIELPTISVVLVSGMMLWQREAWALEYLPKVLFGIGAIAMNLLCYYFVEKRSADSGVFAVQSTRILRVTVPGFLCFFAAAYLGGIHAGWY